jgi:hypothetical protein
LSASLRTFLISHHPQFSSRYRTEVEERLAEGLVDCVSHARETFNCTIASMTMPTHYMYLTHIPPNITNR